jgi:hypothetical protein
MESPSALQRDKNSKVVATSILQVRRLFMMFLSLLDESSLKEKRRNLEL